MSYGLILPDWLLLVSFVETWNSSTVRSRLLFSTGDIDVFESEASSLVKRDTNMFHTVFVYGLDLLL